MKNLFLLLLFTISFSGAFSQTPKFTAIHNAQAIDWVHAVKYLGVPYGPVLTRNSDRSGPALFFLTADSVGFYLYNHLDDVWEKVGSGTAAEIVRDNIAPGDTCIIIDSLGPHDFHIRFNENCSGAGGSGITALTGDVTASGTGSVAATLATVNSSPGTYTNATVTVNGKGLVTSASAGATPGLNAVLTQDSTSVKSIKLSTAAPVTKGTMTFFGDSWTVGYQLIDAVLKWTTRVANYLGYGENNAGLSSSTLMKRTPIDPFGATNMIDRINLIPFHSTGDKIVFAYGFNDMRYNGSNYDTANFRADYKRVLDSTVSAYHGFAGSDIILVAPGYMANSAYISISGNPAPTVARHLQFIEIVRQLAVQYGAKFFDSRAFMLAHGDSALLQPDMIHPNVQGHEVLAAGFLDAYSEPVRSESQKLAVNGTAQFSKIILNSNISSSSGKNFTLAADSAGNIVKDLRNYVRYNKYGNVIIGDHDLPDTPYNFAAHGKAFFNNGLYINNDEQTQLKKYLQLYSDPLGGGGLIDAFTPGGAKAPLYLNTSSKGNVRIAYADPSYNQGHVFDSIWANLGSTVIHSAPPAFNKTGLNLAYFNNSAGGVITAKSDLSTYANISLNPFGGNVSIGMYPATARFQIAAGTSTAGTAPFKFTSGDPTTTPEIGALHFKNGLLILDSSNSKRDTLATRSWTRDNIQSGSSGVTSVGLSAPSWLSVSGSPVTSSGTLAITAASGQTANRFLATPDGSTGTVSLRAIASGDLPSTIAANTTGSAASLTTARKINGVSFNGTADIAVDKRIIAYQALGSAIVAENVDGQLAQVINSLAMTSQRAYFQAVYIDKDQTITGFKWKQATAGSYTANNYNGGALYSYSGGTLTLVASSTNDGNIWTATSGTIGSKAFSSTYSATAGLYFVAIIWSASATTTAPSLGTLTATSSINTVTDFTNSAKTSGLISSLTALPSPTQASSGITASANEFWIGLY